MTEPAPVVCGLVLLALLDGAFSGFRSAAGRNGLIRRGAADLRAQMRGLAVGAVLLLPAAVLALAAGGDALVAGRAMLAVYAPYAAVVLLALLVHQTVGWRLRFLAMAVVLGPATLLRPLVAVAGGMSGVLAVDGVLAPAAVALAVAAVLAVEPVCDRFWYARRPEQSATRS